MFKLFILCLLVLVVSNSWIAHAGDPDILSDFIAPINSTVDGNFFTFREMHAVFQNPTPENFTGTKASMIQFPALNGQSVSMDVLQFPPGSINPPHTRSRATGLLYVLEGNLEVGLIDTNNKLYTQTLQPGDIFVFPKGLVHYQYNADSHRYVTAVAVFGSANAGGISVPSSVFTSGIGIEVLAKAFKTDVGTVRKIEGGLGVKA